MSSVKLKKRTVDLRRSSVPSSTPSSRKKRKASYTRYWVLPSALVGALLLIALALRVFTHMGQYQVTEFSVTGAKDIPEDRIIASAQGYVADANTHFVSEASAPIFSGTRLSERLVKDLPRIAKVQVDRSGLFSTAATISVTERAAFAKWCREEWCYALDEHGFIFGDYEASMVLGTGYTYKGGIGLTESPLGQTLIPMRFAALTKVLRDLQSRSIRVTTIEFRTENDIAFTLESGAVLVANLDALNAEFLKSADIILSSKEIQTRLKDIDYIDFRFGNRVYYSFKKDSAESATSTATQK